MKVSEKSELIDMQPCSDPHSPWFNKHQEYVLAKCAFYQCNDCAKPFYGGLIDCERDLSDDMANKRKEDLVCKKCTLKQMGGGQYDCKIHGHQHIIWKCHKCCREATYYCGGMSYLCDMHHDAGGPIEDCGGIDCPLGVPHPPANHNPKLSLYPLGCSLCKSSKPESAN